MADHITYSLASGGTNSEPYYRRVREFTDEVLERSSRVLAPFVNEFLDYVRTFRLEEVRRDEEYTLELLSFGILWRTYGGWALAVRLAPFVTLARMSEWRKRHQRLKPAIDMARGMLVTLFLFPGRGRERPETLPGLPEVDRLCLWLEATGEFREQALRFIRWRAYWETTPVERRAEMGAAIFAFADWFILRAAAVLGEFTSNIEPFLCEAHGRYRWREDRVQCTRSRAEYHLNMVGAEIMNRAFRDAFTSTGVKSVLLPGCMRGRPEEECEATGVREGLVCNGCLAGCDVNRIRELGRIRGFDVFIIPHASDLSLWSPSPGRPRRGVIASACVTTLVEGGWELKRYDVDAQCVLLDYSGCRKHWRRDGIPTALNTRELKRILDDPPGPARGDSSFDISPELP